jgi:hypothetical protein
MLQTVQPERRGAGVPLYSGGYRSCLGPNPYPKPAARARMMACARSGTWSLIKMFEM